MTALENIETAEFAGILWRRLLGSMDYAISSKHRQEACCNPEQMWGCGGEQSKMKEKLKRFSMSSVL